VKERTKLLLILGVFAVSYFLPIEHTRVQGALLEGFYLLKWYAREHVMLCLVPAFFIAGAIGVFVSQGAVLRYLGASAKRTLAYPAYLTPFLLRPRTHPSAQRFSLRWRLRRASSTPRRHLGRNAVPTGASAPSRRKPVRYAGYGVASVSGAIVAVCSCTVLPLFASIYKRGAGLGPAIAFLYSGPAINVLAIILTARVLGLELGVARAVGAVAFAVIIGLIMAFIFRHEEAERQANGIDPFAAQATMAEDPARRGWQNATFMAVMIGILVFANRGTPNREAGLFSLVWKVHWHLTIGLLIVLGYMIVRWYERTELGSWVQATWEFAKQILPLLFGGVLVAG